MSNLENRLAEARAHWQQTRDRGGNCQHPRTAPMQFVVADGSIQIDDACTTCYARIGGRSIAHRHIADITALPVARDDRYLNPPCQVCGSFGTELHHWAPKEIFGNIEADHWPTSYLCRACHEEWHKRIDDHGNPGRIF